MRVTEVPSAPARVSVTYAGTPLSYVLADFERASRRSIVRSLAVDTLSISVRLIDQPWDLAFASVVQSMGLVSFGIPTGALVVRTGREDAALIKTESLDMYSVQLRRARPRSVEFIVRMAGLTERAFLMIDTTTNTITVTEVVSRIARVRAIVDSLDRPPP